VAICLCLADPLDDHIPSLSPVDLQPRLRQLEFIVLPPLASILHPVFLFVAELIRLTLDFRPTSVPCIVSEQEDCDWMWGSRGLERVLCGVVDQDLCVDLLTDLGVASRDQSFRNLVGYAHRLCSAW